MFKVQNRTSTLTGLVITGTESASYSYAGGLHNDAPVTTLTNTLIVGNTASLYSDVYRSFIDGGGNIIGGNAANIFADLDANGGGLLANNGGPAQTVALNANVSNLALDGGIDSAAPTLDATGFVRVDQLGLPNNLGNITDIGAYELGFASPTITTPSNVTLAEGTPQSSIWL